MNSRQSLIAIIAFALILSSLVYVFGYYVTPPGQRFMGLTYNIDDACVYLSWMRQIADGHTLIRNQFAVEPQQGLQFNVFFFILGLIARISHVPLIAVYHVARVLLSAALLLMVYQFGSMFLKQKGQRITLVLIVALWSGIGWMFGRDTNRALPVDMWQPEAITFLSMYLNPLFLFAQILILASLYYLLRLKTSGKVRDAAFAGLCLLVLANAHTYDLVTVAAVWVVFLAASTVIERRLNIRLIGLTLLAGAIAAPAVLYQWYLYNSEQVFRLRANTPASSPAIWCLLAGFGVMLLLALFGLPRAIRMRKDAILVVIWAAIGFALPYIPIAQQRKLVMGLHIPLAILATLGLVWLSEKFKLRLRTTALVITLIAVGSNIVFISRDATWLLNNETATRMHRPYLSESEMSAMRWLRGNTDASASVLAFPDVACFIPAMAGNRTYVGHWSETPHFAKKLREWWEFADADTSDEIRRAFLRESQTEYVWWWTPLRELPAARPGEAPRLAFNPDNATYLHEVFASRTTKIYRVLLAHQEGKEK